MLIDTVRQTIRSHDLIHRGDHIILGLSGGPDSMCLFHVLLRLRREWDLTIHPVHVNHGLRPGAADRDQAYVEDVCAKAGLSCAVFTVDCSAMAKARGLTSEEAGRLARYQAFRKTAGQLDARACIAVAQNANDQAETILHRILRGTGTDGLSGIAYKRYEEDIPVIRPLLDVTRKQIEDYCESNRLNPVIDQTNMEPIYTRNKIRLQILPLLQEYNPSIIEGLTRLGRIASADKDYLWKQAETEYQRLRLTEATEAETEYQRLRPAETTEGEPEGPGRIILDREGMAGLAQAIRHRLMVRVFRDLGLDSDVSEERLRAADAIICKKQGPKAVEFPRGYRLLVQKGRAEFTGPEDRDQAGRGAMPAG